MKVICSIHPDICEIQYRVTVTSDSSLHRQTGSYSTRDKVQIEETGSTQSQKYQKVLLQTVPCVECKYCTGRTQGYFQEVHASVRRCFQCACYSHRKSLSVPYAHSPGWPHLCPCYNPIHCPIGPSAQVLFLPVAPCFQWRDLGTIPRSQVPQPARQHTQLFLWLDEYSWATAVCWRCRWLVVNESDFGIHFWNLLWRSF